MPDRVPTNKLRRRLVAFKLNDDEYAALLPFFETFPLAPMSSAMLWLMEQPQVRQTVRERVESAMVQS